MGADDDFSIQEVIDGLGGWSSWEQNHWTKRIESIRSFQGVLEISIVLHGEDEFEVACWNALSSLEETIRKTTDDVFIGGEDWTEEQVRKEIQNRVDRTLKLLSFG